MSAKAKKDRDELELKLIGAHQAILDLCGTPPLQRAGKRAADSKLGGAGEHLGETCRK